LERSVYYAKADVLLNPGRCSSWEKLAVDYHGAADELLVSGCMGGRRALLVT